MLDSIFSAIKHSALEVDKILKNAHFDYADTKNSTGDLQLTSDVEANEIFKNALLGLEAVKGIASEEDESVIYKESDERAYLVAFDPLDGSSIVDSNFSVGSIFGIYNGEFSGDFISLDSNLTKKKFWDFYSQDFFKACDYCHDMSKGRTYIPMAIQTDKTLELKA